MMQAGPSCRERRGEEGRITKNRSKDVLRAHGVRYSAIVKHLKQLLSAGVVAFVGFAIMAPMIASAQSNPAAPKKCQWDKKTGKMICQRASR